VQLSAVLAEKLLRADAILEEPLQIQDGLARVPDRPGIGLT
jgi:hypothetical protein